MAKELTYKDEAAAGYDRAFGHVTTHFAPYLLRAAHIVPGMRVLDIATGTGLAAEAALRIVGPDAAPAAEDRPRRNPCRDQNKKSRALFITPPNP